MEQIKLTIRTLSPIVLTDASAANLFTESRNIITGSMIRGVLSNAYIYTQKLDTKNAHENEEFRRLFFHALRFLDAFPSVGGEKTIVLPASLQHDKAKKNVKDLLFDSTAAGYKTWKKIGVVDAEGVVTEATVHKEISLHMSRNSEEINNGGESQGQSTGKERILGRSAEGKIYTYEAVRENTEFIGYILGEKGDLLALRKGLRLKNESFECCMGRSKFAQYGHCEISFGDLEEISIPQEEDGHRIYLRLETAFIPQQQCSMDAGKTFQSIADTITTEAGTGEKVYLVPDKIFASAVTVDNFVGVWGMMRPRASAIAAGSVFVLGKDVPWQEKELRILWRIMLGGELSLRSEEGFGQLRQWKRQSVSVGSKKKDNNVENTSQHELKKIDAETASKAQLILSRWLQDRVMLYASDEIDRLAKTEDLSSLTSMFTRLEKLLYDKDGNRRPSRFFNDVLKAEILPGQPFDQHLQSLRLPQGTLKDLLLKEMLPCEQQEEYQEDRVKAESIESVVGKTAGIEKDALFWAYWYSFFRHGRKKSVKRGEEGK